MQKVVELRPGFKGRPAENPHFSYVDIKFVDGYEAAIRVLTKGPDPEQEKLLPLQDKLIYAFITVNRTTGCASEFGWASGRRDVHIILDMDYDQCSAQAISERAVIIAKLKEKYHDRGFIHEGYEGGFAEFAQNFERATGRRCPDEIIALCEGESRKTA